MERSSSASAYSSSSSSSSASFAEIERELIAIQNEPKALSEMEFNLAMEAALEVIKNNSKEEALKIFLEGLEPVVTSVKLTWDWELEDLFMSDSDEEFIERVTNKFFLLKI